jgi:cytochrome P450
MTVIEATRSIGDVPLDKIHVADPALHAADAAWPVFARLRAEDPVHYCPDSPIGPYWSITKYADLMYCDVHWELFTSEPVVVIDPIYCQGGPEGGVTLPSFITMDPPKHDQQRKAVSPAVAPSNLAKLEPLIRERAARVLRSLPIGEEFDWVEQVSVELTTQMLATLVDFPFEERHRLTRWSNVASAIPGDGVVDSWDQRNAELLECGEWFQRLWDERIKAEPKNDLISLMAHNPATQGMHFEEFLANVILLIVGGNDTTRNTMSGSVLAMHRNQDQWEKLKANPALVDSMVPEAIRWQSPVAYQARRARVDTELHGKTIRQGDTVALWYMSGNRDGEAIENPEAFIIDRPRPREHISFGFGIHRCVGNRLAELQLRVLWEEILKMNWKRIEVTAEPQRMFSSILRGITYMPVRIHA